MRSNIKIAAAILLTVTSILFLSSCGKKSSAAYNSSSNSAAGRRGTFSQNVPDLYGEVKSITGNSVTLALLDIPQGRQPNAVGGQNRQRGSSNSGNQGSSSNGSNAGQGRAFSITKKYTGKSETLTIPSGTSITSYQRNSNGSRSEKKLSVSDIKVGSLIQIWYKKNTGSSKEIQSIRVISMTQSNQVQQK